MRNLNRINKSIFYSALSMVLALASQTYVQAQTQRFKRIDYHYDLISGKVNEVHYQAGQPDAFYHIYQYDADNRITRVFTSKDSIIWDKDAGYAYYAHGPLARVEVGDNKAQGMDYAYTLQGWIKGVNSNLLKAENDIGSDGLSTGPNSKVAKDAYGYTLNYHAGDYKPIETSKWSNTARRFEALTPNSDLMAARYDLFNGNIGSMVTTIMEPKVYTGAPNEMPNILPQGTAYQYDQLNRLLEMKAFQNLDAATNAWQQGSTYTGLYHNAFKYDANGNILGQFRADGAGTTIDSLTYKYVKDAGRTISNRLYHVNDQVSQGAFTDDIDNQGTFNNDLQTMNDGISNNYRYDEIGNLIKDTQEGIDKIEWTVYGKIKSITRLSGSLRSDLEFLYDAGGNRIAKIEKPRDVNGLKPQNDWITTYYTRDAQGNVMGIYKFTTVTTGPSFEITERHLYGSSRLGSDYTQVELVGASSSSSPFSRTLGNKHFEGSNHLGNVLTVFSDRKIPRDDNSVGGIDYFQVDVLSANDYSPFGVVLDGRDFGVGGRYGFNGKENDDEVKGEGNYQDYGMRSYDGRLGRFLSVDMITKSYPMLTPYQFASNSPIWASDLDGLEARVESKKDENGNVIAIKIIIDIQVKNGTNKALGDPAVMKKAEEFKAGVENLIKGEVKRGGNKVPVTTEVNITPADAKSPFVVEFAPMADPDKPLATGMTKVVGSTQSNYITIGVDPIVNPENPMQSAPITGDLLEQTSAHEMGHALGLKHVFKWVKNLMNPITKLYKMQDYTKLNSKQLNKIIKKIEKQQVKSDKDTGSHSSMRDLDKQVPNQ